ncbi:MAG: type II secretion system F family protein [Clostridiales bacterium]|nr:type II secretion system F family protein [Clostridiales bacterium]
MRNATDQYLSAFCGELSLIIKAGITVYDGLLMLRDDETDKQSQEVLGRLAEAIAEGRPFSAALHEARIFPDYLLDMILLAEKTGRLEDTLIALSIHYARQDRLKKSIRAAVFYPALLLVIMLIVIGVLVIRVLPIFGDTYNQMGVQMLPFARGLMNFGQTLSDASGIIGIVLSVLVVFIGLIVLIPSVRVAVYGFLKQNFGGRGVFESIRCARFASAMSMAKSSGMNTEEAMELAELFYRGTKATDRKLRKCTALLREGKKISEAFGEAGIFEGREIRALAIGDKTGNLPFVLGDVADRCEETAENELDSLVGRIEPSLVIITSVLVGLILLSVMLPLAGIMSSLGA